MIDTLNGVEPSDAYGELMDMAKERRVDVVDRLRQRHDNLSEEAARQIEVLRADRDRWKDLAKRAVSFAESK